jgi:hypothetical protein
LLEVIKATRSSQPFHQTASVSHQQQNRFEPQINTVSVSARFAKTSAAPLLPVTEKPLTNTTMPSPDLSKVKEAVLKYSGVKKRDPQVYHEPEDQHRRKYVKQFGDTCRKGFRNKDFLHTIR